MIADINYPIALTRLPEARQAASGSPAREPEAWLQQKPPVSKAPAADNRCLQSRETPGQKRRRSASVLDATVAIPVVSTVSNSDRVIFSR